MEWYYLVAATLVAFLFMEFVAWFTHKYVMHGFLWVLHKDHHYPTGKKLQLNDLFALIFAVPSMVLMIIGLTPPTGIAFYFGLGIALYGLAYFLFHDVLVHKRLNLFGKIRSKVLKAIITAHYDHHSGNENYGFIFMIPWRYFRAHQETSSQKSY